MGTTNDAAQPDRIAARTRRSPAPGDGARRWLLAALCAAFASPAAAQSLTEAQAAARMRAEYPRLTALRFAVRELQADARERTLPTNPAFTYTREEAGPAADDFLLVSQELPLWGRRRLVGEAARHEVSARAADADARRLAVEAELRLAFTDLLLAQDRARSLETGVGRLDVLIAVLRTREEQGEGSRFDRLRAEREVAEVDADLALAGIDLRRAQARLAAYFAVGTDPDGLTAAGRLDDPPAPPAPALGAERVPESRPEYRALGLEARRWGVEGRAARRLRLPSAQVTGGMKRSGVLGSMDTGFVLGASVSVPVFNRGQAQAARAAAAAARVEAERRSLAARIAAEVHAAAAAAAGARELAQRYRDDSVFRAAELVAIATAAYEEGEFGILELLDAHRVSLRANLRALDLSAAARRAAIELDRAAGREMTP